jgi:hypothetical protein
VLSEGPPIAFSFDGRPLSAGDTEGIPLQLQDGLDGTPLTRSKLAGREALYCGTSRGFAIRIHGLNVLDPALGINVKLVAADLSNLAAPNGPGGAPLSLTARDVAVDPQLGRFLLDAAGLETSPGQVRVDYLLGPARVMQNAVSMAVDSSAPQVFAFSPDGAAAPLRDAFDGTLIAVKLRLGHNVTEFHGAARGWVIRKNGVDITATLTASVQSLEFPAGALPASAIAVDPERGRFQFPPGFLAPGDQVTVDFSFEDLASEYQLLQGFAQRAPRLVPAEVAAVVVDSRRMPVNPAVLL